MAYLSQTDLIKQFIQENLQEGNAGNGHVRNNQYLHLKNSKKNLDIFEALQLAFILEMSMVGVIFMP